MAIAGYYFDPQISIDLSILSAMATICSIVLGKEVDINELPYLYEHNYTCRLEIESVIG